MNGMTIRRLENKLHAINWNKIERIACEFATCVRVYFSCSSLFPHGKKEKCLLVCCEWRIYIHFGLCLPCARAPLGGIIRSHNNGEKKNDRSKVMNTIILSTRLCASFVYVIILHSVAHGEPLTSRESVSPIQNETHVEHARIVWANSAEWDVGRRFCRLSTVGSIIREMEKNVVSSALRPRKPTIVRSHIMDADTFLVLNRYLERYCLACVSTVTRLTEAFQNARTVEYPQCIRSFCEVRMHVVHFKRYKPV